MIEGWQWRLVAIGLFLALGVGILAEMTVRLRSKDACIQPDPLLGFKLKPKATCQRQSRDFKVTYQINAWGLRDREISEEKSGQVKRILLLGDSFTEGTGVSLEATFGKQLEDLLKLEVINAGVSGYSTLQEYLWLKERGLRLQPDLIILNVNETDFGEAAKYHPIWEQNGYINLQPSKTSFLTSIRLLSFLRERLGKLLRQQSQKTTVFMVSDKLWQLVRSDIARINFITRGKNIPLLVVFQPHGHQVSATAWKEGRTVHGFVIGKKYPTIIPKLVADLSQQLGFEFLDLSPAFETTDAAQFYFPYDGHWTAAGHSLAAKVIGEYLNDYVF